MEVLYLRPDRVEAKVEAKVDAKVEAAKADGKVAKRFGEIDDLFGDDPPQTPSRSRRRPAAQESQSLSRPSDASGPRFPGVTFVEMIVPCGRANCKECPGRNGSGRKPVAVARPLDDVGRVGHVPEAPPAAPPARRPTVAPFGRDVEDVSAVPPTRGPTPLTGPTPGVAAPAAPTPAKVAPEPEPRAELPDRTTAPKPLTVSEIKPLTKPAPSAAGRPGWAVAVDGRAEMPRKPAWAPTRAAQASTRQADVPSSSGPRTTGASLLEWRGRTKVDPDTLEFRSNSGAAAAARPVGSRAEDAEATGAATKDGEALDDRIEGILKRAARLGFKPLFNRSGHQRPAATRQVERQGEGPRFE
jgi:hypothetical protein